MYSHAIRFARNTTDATIAGGSTANVCAIDLTKAFNKVNHYAPYAKLMKQFIPFELLNMIESWLSSCYSCVKWDNVWSTCGQRLESSPGYIVNAESVNAFKNAYDRNYVSAMDNRSR